MPPVLPKGFANKQNKMLEDQGRNPFCVKGGRQAVSKELFPLDLISRDKDSIADTEMRTHFKFGRDGRPTLPGWASPEMKHSPAKRSSLSPSEQKMRQDKRHAREMQQCAGPKHGAEAVSEDILVTTGPRPVACQAKTSEHVGNPLFILQPHSDSPTEAANAMSFMATGTPRRRVGPVFESPAPVRIRRRAGALLLAVAAFFSILSLPETAVGQTITIESIGDFTEFPTASRTVEVRASGGSGTLRYKVEPVGFLPFGIRVEPTELTDMVNGAGEVTITNPGRRIQVLRARVTVTDGTNTAMEEFTSVFTDRVAPFLPPILSAVSGDREVELAWSHAGRQRVTGYQYRQNNGAWTAIPDSNVDTVNYVRTGLANGTSYTFEVRALNAQGIGPASNSVTVTPMFLAPPILKAEPGDGEVELVWSYVGRQSVSAYQYRQNNGRWMATHTRNNHVLTGLVNGTSYTYEVRAVNTQGEGPASNSVTVTPALTLNAPTGLTQHGTRFTTAFAVRWNAVANATGYVATAMLDGSETAINGTVSGTEATFTNLTINSPYFVSVYATGDGTNYQFRSEATPPLLVKTAEMLFLPSPVDALIAESGDAEATLRWMRTLDPSITRYEYRYRTGANFTDPWVEIPSGDAMAANHTVTGLTNGTEYQFELRAVNTVGAGPPSLARVIPLPLPLAPEGVMAEPGDASATLRWTRTTDPSVTGYEYTRDGGTTWVAFPRGSAQRRVTGLTSGQSYTFRLRALNVNGAGPASAAVDVALTALNIVDARVDEGASGSTDMVFTMTLMPPSNSPVTVNYTTEDGTATVADSDYTRIYGTFTFAANETSETITVQVAGDADLEENERFTVRLSSPSGAALVDGEAVGTITDDDRAIRVAPISDFTEFPTASRTVDVTASGGGTLQYRVEPVGFLPYGIRLEPTDLTDMVNGTGEVTITNPGRRVQVLRARVVVTDGTNTSTEQFRSVFTDRVAPFISPILRAEPRDGEVELVWSHAGRQRVTGYQYRQNNGLWTVVPDSNVDTVNYVLTGLSNGTLYTFEVRALNALGIGPVSNSVTVVPALPLDAPTGLTQHGTRFATAFAVRWNAVANATGYVATATLYGSETAINGTVSGTEAIFTNLTATTVYFVSVYATGDGTNYQFRSEATPPLGVKTAALFLPYVVDDLIAEAGDAEVTLRWMRTLDPSITRYEYRYRTGANFTDPWVEIPSGDAMAASHTVTGLTNGVAYLFELRAVNAVGAGPSSTARVVPLMLPDAPTGLRTEAEEGAVRLYWTQSTDTSVTGYEYSTDGGDNWVAIADRTDHRVAGLTNGRTYTFYLRALSARGASAASTAVATPDVAPGAPTNLQAQAGDEQVTLTWAAPTSGGRFGKYQLWHTLAPTWTDIPGSDREMAATRYVVTGLTNDPEQPHSFRVRAANDAAVGPHAEASATPTGPLPTLSIEGQFVRSEGGGTFVMQARLSRASDERVVVDILTADGSAIAGTDYTERRVVGRVLSPGIISTEFSVQITQDSRDEGDETFTVRLSNSRNAAISTIAGTVTATIVDDDSSDITIGPIADFTEKATRIRTVTFSASHSGGRSLQYRVETVEPVPQLGVSRILVEPASAKRLENGAGVVTIENLRKIWGVLRVRVIVHEPTNDVEAERAFTATLLNEDEVAPSRPAELKARPGEGAVELTWLPQGDLSVTSYEYKQNSGRWIAIPGSDAHTVRHTVTGLTNGTPYTFEIRSVNAQGSGDASDAVTATPMALPAMLPAVANLRTLAGRNRVRLLWDRPSLGTGADLSYVYRIGTQPPVDIAGSDASTTSQDFLNLLPGTYTIVVWARNNSNNQGGVQSSVTVTIEGPPAPGGLHAEAGDGVVTLRWTVAPTPRVAGYQYQVDGGPWLSAIRPGGDRVPGDGTDFRIEGLTNGQEYTFGLRAQGNPSEGQYGYGPSAEVTATPASIPLLQAPRGLEVTAGTLRDTTFTVQWDAVPNAVGYVATATLPRGTTTVSGMVTGTEAAFTNLMPGTLYVVLVRAMGDGTNYQSLGRVETLLVGTAQIPALPKVPEAFEVTPDDGLATLRWARALDASITGYEYRYRTGEDFPDRWMQVPVGDALAVRPMHTVMNLMNGVAYVFQLRAVNAVGAGPVSPPVRVVPLALPSVPEDVVVEVGNAEVILRWTRTTDTSVTGYEYTTDGGNTWMTFPSGSAHYRVTGLTNGQPYQFQLRAINVNGAGAASAVMVKVPDIGPPDAPSNLQVRSTGNRQVTLTWQMPVAGDGGNIRRYELWRTGAEEWIEIENSGAMTTRHVVAGLATGQSYTFRVRAANDRGESSPAMAELAELPTLSIADVSVAEGNSGETSLEFMVTLMIPENSNQITVDYATADGTATVADADYTAASGTLTFAASSARGNQVQVITVQVTGDAAYERDEDFTVTLNNPSLNAWLLRTGTTATGTIRNDEDMSVFSIEDAVANAGDSMIFMVSLSTESSQQATVDYATADGTDGTDTNGAIAGEDYTAARGTLTFATGDTSKTITVEISEEAAREMDETFMVRLSNPIGLDVDISDGEATGTINSVTDENFQDLIEEVESRSALAIAGDVAEMISRRIRDAGASGQAALSVAGHEIRSYLQAQEELSEMRDPARLGEDVNYTDMKFTSRQLFDNTSFVIPLQLNAGSGGATQMDVWGRASWQSMDGDGDRLDWDGSRRSAQLGIDTRLREKLLAGLVVSWSDGGFDYRDDRLQGSYDNRMVSVHPWVAWSTDNNLDLWASAGYGEGEFTIDDASGYQYKSDTTLNTVSAGASGTLLERDGMNLLLKGEGFLASVDVEDGGASDVDSNRVRIAVEGNWFHETASGGHMTPSLEFGVRADGGDVDTPTGAEIGAGVAFKDSSGRMSLDFGGRVLMADGDVLERGLSGELSYAPDNAGRGLSLNVRSDWGAALMDMERLWDTNVSDIAENDSQTLGSRMRADIKYGLGYASGLLVPYGGIELEGSGDVRYRVGSRYTTSSTLELSLEGTHHTAGSESDIMLKGTLRW